MNYEFVRRFSISFFYIEPMLGYTGIISVHVSWVSVVVIFCMQATI